MQSSHLPSEIAPEAPLVETRQIVEIVTGELTERQLRSVYNQRVIRITHFLQLAERNLRDLNQMSDSKDIDEDYDKVCSVAERFEHILEKMILG